MTTNYTESSGPTVSGVGVLPYAWLSFKEAPRAEPSIVDAAIANARDQVLPALVKNQPRMADAPAQTSANTKSTSDANISLTAAR